jgi:hypothetical protein
MTFSLLAINENHSAQLDATRGPARKRYGALASRPFRMFRERACFVVWPDERALLPSPRIKPHAKWED